MLSLVQSSFGRSLVKSMRATYVRVPVVRCIHHDTADNLAENPNELIHKAKEDAKKGKTTMLGMPHTEGWQEVLSSKAEAAIRADKAPDMTVQEMQSFSVERLTPTVEEKSSGK